MMTIPELDEHILKYIQGVFSQTDMEVLKREVEKLKPGDIYVEVGVDEGRSARVAHEYAHPDVYKLYVDIANIDPHPVSIGRGKWMQQEGMVGIGKKGFFVHGDGDIFPKIFTSKVSLMFLDPHHGYEDIQSCTLAWEKHVKKGGVILFHDYDHPGTKAFLDDHYGDKKEVFHGKIVKVVV